MKNLFITLFLFGMSMAVCSQDYYWYKGTKVPLVRGCRRYIIYEDDKLSESDKSHITYSEDVFYDEIPNLKWGTTSAHAVINDTAHVHYSTISYRKDGDYYDNMFITHRFYVKLKNQEDLPLLQELAAQNNAEIEESGDFPAWYILRCKLDAPKNALELANLFYETTDLFSATEPEIINAFSREFPKTIKSLCDEWNVLEYRYNSYWGGQDEFHTLHYTQKTDTFITNQRYAKLYKENNYLGALREGNNADIYYIPSDSTHEYLLYAFNAHVGDTLKNVWLGFQDEKNHLPFQNVIVKEIQTTNPRTFVLDVERKFINDEIVHGELKWLEGIGFLSSPDGGFFDPLAGGFFYNVLCAYTEGEQVYTSEMGQKYGCYYDGEKPQDRLPSLCDEWNILEHLIALGPEYESFNTLHYRLTTDTIINGTRYVRFELDGAYKGALREGDNRNIYYVPAGSAHEYLLYAFNAKVGDKLENLWFGANEDNSYIINSATVANIESTTPRKYTIDIEWQIICSKDTLESQHSDLVWLEELGFQDGGPLNYECPLNCGGGPVRLILCAYKNGEQVYVSEAGQKYGCEYNGEEPMFTSDTRWDYVYTEMYGGPDYKPTYFSTGPIDTLINHIRYQQIRGFLFRSKGAKVWCLLDSMGIPVERLVYDFDLQIGDSIRTIFTNWEALDYYPDPTPQYVKVTKVENIILPDGRSARRLSYDYRPDDIEHIGSVSVDDGILAPLNLERCTCGKGDHFLCCTRGDILLYEVGTGACDTFFIKDDTPRDTIPLYKDGPGSSTVQPVDPNQIVAVLQMDVLSIFEHIGKEIGYKLSQTSSGNTPIIKRLVKSDTFHESVAVTLTENGTYLLELTHPDWDYTIVGTFEYMGGENAVINTEATVPAAQKILRNGQLLIRKGEKIYTLTGVQIQ